MDQPGHTWADVGAGVYITDGDGVAWKVEQATYDIKRGSVIATVVNADGVRHEGLAYPADRPALIAWAPWTPGLSVVTDMLGATIVENKKEMQAV